MADAGVVAGARARLAGRAAVADQPRRRARPGGRDDRRAARPAAGSAGGRPRRDSPSWTGPPGGWPTARTGAARRVASRSPRNASRRCPRRRPASAAPSAVVVPDSDDDAHLRPDPLTYDHAVLISGSATSVSWIPSEAVTGVTKASFTAGVTHYDDPPRTARGPIADLDRAGAEDRFRFANHISALGRGGRREDRRRRVLRRQPRRDGRDDAAVRPAVHPPRGDLAAAPARAADRLGHPGHVPSDLRRTPGHAVPATRLVPAVRAGQRPARVDDAGAGPARRRPGRAPAGRREPLSAALGLRHRQAPWTRSPASPTSPSGRGRASASTARGAGRTPPRSCPPSRRRWSARSRT